MKNYVDMELVNRLREVRKKHDQGFLDRFDAPLSMYWDHEHGLNLLAVKAWLLNGSKTGRFDIIRDLLTRRYGVGAGPYMFQIWDECVEVIRQRDLELIEELENEQL